MNISGVDNTDPVDIVHYVIVRRDLPVGVCAAMIVHAAGETGARFADWLGGAAAIVLGVDNQEQLWQTVNKLRQADIDHYKVIEGGDKSPYKGQLMAVGIVPGVRARLSPHFSEYRLLDSLTFTN